jgi:F-type H+-transporting ATPase subunit b
MAAQVINFAVLVAILAKFAYKPFLKILEDRKMKIQNDLDSAEQNRLDGEKFKQEYLDKLEEARIQAQSIMDKAVRTAEQAKDEIIKQAQEESAKLLKNAKDEINRERDKAINELRAEVVTLSLAAASKIINKNMDDQVNAELVENFISNLDKDKIGGLPC